MNGDGRILRRSDDALIGGVCAGLAEWLGWSSATRMRIAYVLVSVFSAAFPGILVYIVLWLILPPPEYGASEVDTWQQ